MEDELNITPAKKVKTVYVAGAGPAGAEAAIVLAQRGHKVTIFEKSDRIGGMYGTAAVPPWKGEISAFVVWQKTQMEKLGVTIKYNTELTKEIVDADKPDTVVVATGSHPFVPPFPGKDQDFVRSAVDILNGKEQAEGTIAVIGGGLVGGETANFLATHGSQVTIIEMLPEIVAEEPDNMKRFLLKSFAEHQVDIHENTAVSTINSDKTITVDCKGEKKNLGPFDYIVTAVGMRANTELKDTLEDIVSEVVYVGDASAPGNALSAIKDGYVKALEI